MEAGFVNQKIYLEISKQIKRSDTLCSYLACKRLRENNELNKKLRVSLEVLDKLSTKYPETKEYMEQNMKEVGERRNLTVQEESYFVFLFR